MKMRKFFWPVMGNLEGKQDFLGRVFDALVTQLPVALADYFWQLAATLVVLLFLALTYRKWQCEHPYPHRVKNWAHEKSTLPGGHGIVVPYFKPHPTRHDRSNVFDSPQGELEIIWKGIPLWVRLQRKYRIGKWDKLPVDSFYLHCPNTGGFECIGWVFALNGNVLHLSAKDFDGLSLWEANYQKRK